MFQGVAKASAAFRLMQQMGWEEGNGLGKDMQGIKQHLKVKKNQDNAGIGLEDTRAHKWALNTVQYDSILKDLKVVAAAVAVANQDSRKADNDDDDDGVEEEKLKVRKVARPQGRYKKREQNKLVGDYSETDLQAILGNTGKKTELHNMVEKSQQASKILTKKTFTSVPEPDMPTIDEVCQTALKSKKAKSKSKKPSKSVMEDIVVKSIKDETSDDPLPSFPCYPADWWGNKYGFVSAGGLGAMTGKTKKESAGFREEDQENLYKQVKDNASTSRQGLGTRDQKIRKFEHGDWKGRKTLLDCAIEEESTGTCISQEKEERKKERKRQKTQVMEAK